LAGKLLDKFGVKIGSLALIPSSGGIFELIVDDSLVFSKKALVRFPEEGEIETILQKLL
jgi:selenoprotein W-related protein